jgi:hypothetical protein
MHVAKSNWSQVSFAAAAKSKLPAIDYCLANLLAGTVGVVAAPAGVGKTSLLLQIGVAVAAGIPVANGALPAPEQTGRVVFLAAEDPPAILERRAHFLIKNLLAQGHSEKIIAKLETHFKFLSLNGEVPKILTKSGIGESSLDRLSTLANGTRLLILDPIRGFHWCDEQDYGQMSLLFRLLADIATRRSCTIVFSHHVSHAAALEGADEADDLAHGSGAFIDATRWLLNMNTMTKKQSEGSGITEEQRRNYVRINMTKSNYGPPFEPCWLRRSVEFEGVFEQCALPKTRNG